MTVPLGLWNEATPRPGALNMALDEALFQAVESGASDRLTVRLYAWSPPCLSLGFHQSFDEACDEGYCKGAGIDIVRRPTGGKAVLHDDEVTYSVVGSQCAPPFQTGGLLETYGVIARALSEGLSSLGLDVAMKERAAPVAPRGGAPCFLVPSQGELTVGGRKVVGSAQRRGRRAFLQHGSIPLGIDYERTALASRRPLSECAAYREAFAGLSELKPGVTSADLRSALAASFLSVFGGHVREEGPEGAQMAAAERLRCKRYGTDAWTRHSPPPANLR